jgi:hypothetical protein
MMWSNSTIYSPRYIFFFALAVSQFLDVALCCVKQQRAGPPLSHYGTSPSLFFLSLLFIRLFFFFYFQSCWAEKDFFFCILLVGSFRYSKRGCMYKLWGVPIDNEEG